MPVANLRVLAFNLLQHSSLDVDELWVEKYSFTSKTFLYTATDS